MLVLAFGSFKDNQAWDVADKLKKDFPKTRFIKTSNVDDILNVQDELIILDAVLGITKPRLLGIDELKDRRLNTLHDFDIGFFLKLLKQIGKIKKIKIIGIPMKIDENIIEQTKQLL